MIARAGQSGFVQVGGLLARGGGVPAGRRSRTLGAAGGSCGVDNPIQLARRHPEVKTRCCSPAAALAGDTSAPAEFKQQIRESAEVADSATGRVLTGVPDRR